MEMIPEATFQESFQIAEEGEAIGTVQQFADRLPLSAPMVLPCLKASASASVVVMGRSAGNPLLIVSAEGIKALVDCAAKMKAAVRAAGGATPVVWRLRPGNGK